MSNISGVSGINTSAYYATVANATQSTIASQLPSAFSNLNLSQTQQTQISQILQNAQNGNLSSSQVQSQIESVLNPQQLAQLKSEQRHGHHHHAGQSSNANSSSSSSDDDEFGITTPTSTSSAAAITEAANTYWAQSQITPQSQT